MIEQKKSIGNSYCFPSLLPDKIVDMKLNICDNQICQLELRGPNNNEAIWETKSMLPGSETECNVQLSSEISSGVNRESKSDEAGSKALTLDA